MKEWTLRQRYICLGSYNNKNNRYKIKSFSTPIKRYYGKVNHTKDFTHRVYGSICYTNPLELEKDSKKGVYFSSRKFVGIRLKPLKIDQTNDNTSTTIKKLHLDYLLKRPSRRLKTLSKKPS